MTHDKKEKPSLAEAGGTVAVRDTEIPFQVTPACSVSWDREDIKRTWADLEMEITISELKTNTLDGIQPRSDVSEEKNNKLEDKATETLQ